VQGGGGDRDKVIWKVIEIILYNFAEYEKLKRENQEAAEKSKQDQLKKLQKDLGHGESVAMETNREDEQPLSYKNPEISLGANDEAEADIDGDEMPEDPQEQKSFERFLSREREKCSDANP
jgi:hypothetical protein